MTRKSKSSYKPIHIEARQPNGEWWLRNAFVYQNAEVLCGDKPRNWLVAHAYSIMLQWVSNYGEERPLRITGAFRYSGEE